MTARAIQIREVSRDVLREMDDVEAAPPPPVDWFVMGPRGGWYEAVGRRTRRVTDDFEDFFIRNTFAVIDTSEGVRYLRPGTARHALAQSTRNVDK